MISYTPEVCTVLAENILWYYIKKANLASLRACGKAYSLDIRRLGALMWIFAWNAYLECGRSNVPKVEVGKHITFHTMEKKSSCEQWGKAFTHNVFFGSIQELLLGKSHIYMSTLWENNHKKPSSQKACSKGPQHDQKKSVTAKNLYVYWVWKVQCHSEEICLPSLAGEGLLICWGTPSNRYFVNVITLLWRVALTQDWSCFSC